jgi:hypothetical protein
MIMKGTDYGLIDLVRIRKVITIIAHPLTAFKHIFILYSHQYTI